MIYEDEGHAQYYVEKTTGMVKALIDVFEGKCLDKGMQVYLLEIIHPHTVLVTVSPPKVSTCVKLEEEMNQEYRRKDKMWTCQLLDEEEGSFLFFGTDDRSLKNLN
jgi:hypothetical protein